MKSKRLWAAVVAALPLICSLVCYHLSMGHPVLRFWLGGCAMAAGPLLMAAAFRNSWRVVASSYLVTPLWPVFLLSLFNAGILLPFLAFACTGRPTAKLPRWLLLCLSWPIWAVNRLCNLIATSQLKVSFEPGGPPDATSHK